MELDWKRRASFFLVLTPALCEEWLRTRNHFNRDVKPTRVAGYSRDMTAGRWHVNGEGILFDWNGEMINGQHRALAVVDAGVPVEMLIVTGLDPRVRQSIDTGSTRDVRDSFYFAGMDHYLGTNLGKNTAAGMWARMKYGLSNLKGRDTREETLAFARTYPEGGLFALEQFGSHKRMRSISVAPVLAAVARAFYSYTDHVRLARFVEVLCTGMQRHPDDRTVIVLREMLINARTHGKNSNFQPEIYGKTARTIQAYMRGDLLSRLYCPTEEPFPLPDRSTTDPASNTDRVSGDSGQFNTGRSSAPLLAEATRVAG